MGSRALHGCTCPWLLTLLIPRWLVSGTALVVPLSDPQDAASVGAGAVWNFSVLLRLRDCARPAFPPAQGKHSWVHRLLSLGDYLSVRQGENPLRNVPGCGARPHFNQAKLSSSRAASPSLSWKTQASPLCVTGRSLESSPK